MGHNTERITPFPLGQDAALPIDPPRPAYRSLQPPAIGLRCLSGFGLGRAGFKGFKDGHKPREGGSRARLSDIPLFGEGRYDRGYLRI